MKTWNGYQKGVNLGGWFSQCEYSKEHFDSFITEKDFEVIAGWGADHVRLPIDYNLVEQERADGSINYLEEGFDYISRAYEWARQNNLNIIIDLHKTAGYSFDAGEKQEGFFESETLQERFYCLWEELAKRFGNQGSSLAFELLNEVTDKEYMETWKKISLTCIDRIRKIAPDVDILLGGYWNNSVEAVADLPTPPDSHIIYNFHCYEPLIFTHQGAYWAEGMPVDYRMAFDQTIEEYFRLTREIQPNWVAPIQTAETLDGPMDSRFFEALFAQAIATAGQRDVALYCGEYGVINRATPEDTLKWYQAIHPVFEKYGIGRAAWSYREMDFGLSDDHLKHTIAKLVPYL